MLRREAGGTALVVDSPGRDRRRARRRAVGAGAKVSPDPGVNCVDTAFMYRFKQLWNAPPNGLYGVEAANGFVGPWEEGFLYGSAAIFFFVLAVGAFITVTMKTEAIQTGIGRLALRFRHSGSVLIAMLMVVFALGGTTYGMWEETLGFFVLLVPLALALALRPHGRGGDHLPRRRLGRDRLDRQPVLDRRRLRRGRASASATASACGSRSGSWSSRSRSATSSGTRAGSRRTPAKSIVGISATDATEAESLVCDVPALTGRQKVVLTLFMGDVPGHDLRLHPLERPLAGGLRQGLPAADLLRLLLPRGGRRCSS